MDLHKSLGIEQRKEITMDNYSGIWDTLEIPQPNIPRMNYNQWPLVMDEKGKQVRADKIMKKHWLGDNMPNANPGGYGGNININQINSLALDNVFLGWGELSLLQTNCIIQNICSIMSQSMTEKWIKFRSRDETKQDKIIELEKEFDRFKVKEIINKMLYNTMLLGTSYLNPKFKDDEEYQAEELIIDPIKIKKGSLEEFFVIEPTWVVPIEFNMVNPRMPNFYSPEAYILYGKRIHATRMKRTMFIKPLNLLSPMYLFGGIPPIQQILPYILDYLNTKKQIVQIISRFNLSIIQTNMNALGSAGVMKRIQALNQLKNNSSVLMMDKETEAFTQVQVNLTGLADLLQQQGEMLSLFSQIPVSKLFGEAPKGLNATGEYDAQNFNALIHTKQENDLRPVLDYISQIIQLNTFGEIDQDIEFDFNPLGELSDTLKSVMRNDKVTRAVNLVNAGIANPESMMELLASDPEMELSNYEKTELI